MQATNAHLTEPFGMLYVLGSRRRPPHLPSREEDAGRGRLDTIQCSEQLCVLRVMPACGELMESDSEANTTRTQ